MMDDLLKALLEGNQPQKPVPQSTQPKPNAPGMDILSDLLQQQPQQQPNGLNIADLVGMVLGGGQPAASDQTGMNPLVAPIANMLAEKIGVSPQIAQMVVSFAMAALLSKGNDRGVAGGLGATKQGFNFDDLPEGGFAYDSGMVSRLSQESGMSEDEAASSLQEAIKMLSEYPGINLAGPERNIDG